MSHPVARTCGASACDTRRQEKSGRKATELAVFEAEDKALLQRRMDYQSNRHAERGGGKALLLAIGAF